MPTRVGHKQVRWSVDEDVVAWIVDEAERQELEVGDVVAQLQQAYTAAKCEAVTLPLERVEARFDAIDKALIALAKPAQEDAEPPTAVFTWLKQIIGRLEELKQALADQQLQPVAPKKGWFR
jgi:hypothetical protein